MLCMLLHIRSPSVYSFMRENKLLPLLCIRSIRNYLQLIKTSCGFDEQFLQLFAKHLEGKEEYQKHGLLILDEISLRQSISVNTKTLTYSGLIDFGSEDLPKANDLSDIATYTLIHSANCCVCLKRSSSRFNINSVNYKSSSFIGKCWSKSAWVSVWWCPNK